MARVQPCRLADLVELGLVARLQVVDQPQGLLAQLLGIFVGQAGQEGEGPLAVFECIAACTQFPLRGFRTCTPGCVLAVGLDLGCGGHGVGTPVGIDPGKDGKGTSKRNGRRGK